jgi:hypothetical protein
LLELDPISLNAWQVIGQLRLHRDPVLHCFAMNQENDLQGRIVDIDGILPWRSFLYETMNPNDNVGRSIGISKLIEPIGGE